MPKPKKNFNLVSLTSLVVCLIIGLSNCKDTVSDFATTETKPANFVTLAEEIRTSQTWLRFSLTEIQQFLFPRETFLGITLQPMQEILKSLNAYFHIASLAINTQNLINVELSTSLQFPLSEKAVLKLEKNIGIDVLALSETEIHLKLSGFGHNELAIDSFRYLDSEGVAKLKLVDGNEVEFDLSPILFFVQEHEAALRKIEDAISGWQFNRNTIVADSSYFFHWFSSIAEPRNKIQVSKSLLSLVLKANPTMVDQAQRFGMNPFLERLQSLTMNKGLLTMQQEDVEPLTISNENLTYPIIIQPRVNLSATEAVDLFNIDGLGVEFKGPLRTRHFPIHSLEVANDQVCFVAKVKILPFMRGRDRTKCI